MAAEAAVFRVADAKDVAADAVARATELDDDAAAAGACDAWVVPSSGADPA